MPSSQRSRSIADKPLPHNLDAERFILGAILLNNEALAKAVHVLHSGDFFLPQHEVIFRSMVRMADAKTPIDLLTLTDTLEASADLEKAGGAAYIAQLADGIPKVTNVEHYAKIVSVNAKRRSIIRAADGWQQQAWNAESDVDTVLTDVTEYLKFSSNGTQDRGLVAVDILDFMRMELAPIDFVIEPILPVSNSGMVYSPAGAGKTYIMLYMSYCVAIGAPCFVWEVPKPRKVLYVDGEMDELTLQERVKQIAKGWDGMNPAKGFIKLITPDQQKHGAPRINSKEGRQRIEEHLGNGQELMVLDNLSTLCPGGDEEESQDWSIIQEWILDLRRQKIATIIVHHGGKSGSQLGTSKKEHQLSFNLRLRTATDYTPEDGLKVEGRLDKLRRRGKDNRWEPRWGQPFEITLRVDDGAATFTNRPMLELLRKKAVEMLLAGMRENDVAQETGLNRFQIYRIKQKIKSEGSTAAEYSD